MALIRLLIARPWIMALLALTGSIVLSLSLLWTVENLFLARQRADLRDVLFQISQTLQGVTVDGEVMGAASLMGLVHAEIRLAVQGKPADAEAIDQTLEILGEEFDAAHVLLIDGEGKLVADWTRGLPFPTDSDFSAETYFRQALTGQANIIASVEPGSAIRGLNVAAPVFRSADRDSDVIGVVVIKLLLARVETILSRWENPVFLVSPQGVVFATNHPIWLYRIAGPVNDRITAALREHAGLGPIFRNHIPRPLPIDIRPSSFLLQNQRRIIESTPLHWNDPAGEWRLFLTRDLSTWLSPEARWGGMAVANLLLLFGAFFLYTWLANFHHRRKSEEQIRKLGQAVEQSPSAVLITDPSGLIEYVNPSFTDMSGYSAEEAVGQTPQILQSGETDDAVYAELWARVQSGRQWRGELVNRRKDGSHFWVALTISPLRNTKGKITHLLGSQEDISGIKQAEKRFQALLESAPDPIVVTDQDGNIVLVNQQTESLFGHDRDSLLGQPVEMLIPHRFRDAHPAKRQGFLAAPRIRAMGANLELTALRKDGSELPVEVSLSPLETPSGVLVSAAIRDITLRKEAEAALQSSQQELARQSEVLAGVLASIQQGLVAYDAEMKLAACNEPFKRLREVPDHLSRPGTDYADWVRFDAERGEFGPEDPETYVERYLSLARQANRHKFERVRPNGQVLEITGGPLAGGGFVSTFMDITSRKEAERRLQEALTLVSESIRYASQIQRATLPPPSRMATHLPDHFIIWEPRDVVGGDLYWVREWGQGLLIMVGDCTGHGVPGAFMTLIANGALEMNLHNGPMGRCDLLLARMHRSIQAVLRQGGEEGANANDGLELGACFLHPNHKSLAFAGARFSLFQADSRNIFEIKGDKTGIGYTDLAADLEFTQHEVPIPPRTTLYLTTDGLIDQVGGIKRFAFGKKRFKKLISGLCDVPLPRQAEKIQRELTLYQGQESRRDDVTVLGFQAKPAELLRRRSL